MTPHPLKPSTAATELELATSLAAPPPPPTTKIVKPSMSATDRFLECAWPWGREVSAEGVTGAPARFGSAVHEVLERSVPARKLMSRKQIAEIAERWSIDGDVLAPDVEERSRQALAVILAWLDGDNPWSINFTKWKLRYEVPIAYDIEASTAEEIKKADGAHDYGVELPRLPGTADLVGVGAMRGKGFLDTVLVLDHKTGYYVGSPFESGQLQSLALAFARLHGVQKAIIGFVHMPQHTAPTVYVDTLGEDDLFKHAKKLETANARVGDGSLKPGYWCQWCPAALECPTNATAIQEMRPRALMTSEDVGAAHQRLAAMKSRFEMLAGAVDDEIRAWVRKNGAALRPDGQAVDFVPREFSHLSQASIIRTLGEFEGRKLIEKLKKLGCIETGSRKELRVLR
jgi:hypothetical protein